MNTAEFAKCFSQNSIVEDVVGEVLIAVDMTLGLGQVYPDVRPTHADAAVALDNSLFVDGDVPCFQGFVHFDGHCHGSAVTTTVVL